MPRRRLSSDGLKLFNMAVVTPPSYSKIKKMLFCLWHTEYDDQLEDMVKQCRVATEQLLAYTHHKDININKLIDNSIFNLIHSVLMEKGKLCKKRDIKRNYQYLVDVAEKCMQEDDHHSAITLKAALDHHSIGQFRFKDRKKDKFFRDEFEERYGSFRNCYKNHLKEAMNHTEYEHYLPSIMVLNMHHVRHKAFSSIGRCKLAYEPWEIKSRIGMTAMHYNYPGEQMALFEQPQIRSSTDLIMLAQKAS